MKKFLLALILCIASVITANATQVQVTGNVVNYANITGLGATRTAVVTVTNGDTNVTGSATLPANLTGLGGWLISINGSDYEVSNQTSTSALVLRSSYNGTSGTVTATIYPVLTLKIYADKAFTPLGASYIVQPGGPTDANGFYRRIGCSYKNNQIVVPTITLDTMVDAATTVDRLARYGAYFTRLDNSTIRPYMGFTSFQVPAEGPTTWDSLAIYNAPAITYSTNPEGYSAGQVDYLVNNLSLRLHELEKFQSIPEDFGAVADGTKAVGSMSGSTLTATTAVFAPQDVGKDLYVDGAGAVVATGGPNGLLKTTIATYIDSTRVTLASAATINVSGAVFWFGTNSTAAFVAANAEAATQAGVIQMGLGNYIVDQLTLSAHVSLKGVASTQTVTVNYAANGTSIWSALGKAYNAPIEGIIQTRYPINSSFDADNTLQDFNIVGLDRYNFQSGFDEVGGTFQHVKNVLFYNTHWGAILDQTEVSEFEYNNFLSPGLRQGSGYNGGYNPIAAGWTFTGNGNVNIEGGIDPNECEGCGRWVINTQSSLDNTHYSKSIPASSFDKGFWISGKYAEVGAGIAGLKVTNGTKYYLISWPTITPTSGIKINGGTTHLEGTLSSWWGLGIIPGGASANFYIDGVLIETVTAIANTETAGIYWGDIAGSNNSSAYYNIFNYEFSYPTSAAAVLVSGNWHWQSRESKSIAGAYMRSGSNQAICPSCATSSADVTHSLTIAGAGVSGAALSATINSFSGDEYTWLTADVAPSDTSITVVNTSQFPSSGWLYLGGESVYYASKTSTSFTGVIRGLVGSTATTHLSVDGHTVSVNHYQTFVLSASASTTVNAAVITYSPSAKTEFTNRITFHKNQFNYCSPQVVDQGGYLHSYSYNNNNCGSIQYKLIAPQNVDLTHNEHEGMSRHTIEVGGPDINGTVSSRPIGVTIANSLINANTAVAGMRAINMVAGSGININGNYFPASSGSAVTTDNTGAIGSIFASGNTTSGARLFNAPYGSYVYLTADNLANDVSVPSTGGGNIVNLSMNAYRLRTRNIELHYDPNVTERGKTGLGDIVATTTSFIATVSQFTSKDTGSTISIIGANTGGTTLTTTVTYVDGQTLTLATPAVTTVTQAIFTLAYKGAEAKSSNIRFFDDDGSNFFRIYGQSNFTADRTGILPNFSGTFALSNGVLGTNYWLFSNATGQIDGSANATMTSAGLGMLRQLTVKAAAASGTNVMVEFQNSSATPVWDWFYDYTGGWMTLQDGVYNRQQMTVIANATYDYIQLHANEGINWAGYGTTYTSAGGIAKNGSSILEINRGKKIADGGATGDLLLRNLRMQLSGASSAVYFNYTGTPTAARAIAMPDMSSTFVGSSGALTAGRVPFGVAIDSGVGVTDSANFVFNSATQRFDLNASGGAQSLNIKGANSDNLVGFYKPDGTQIGDLTYGDMIWRAIGNNLLEFRSSTTASYGIYLSSKNATGFIRLRDNAGNYILDFTEGSPLTVRPTSSSTIGQIIKLAPSQSADALQVQDSTGAVVTKFSKDGYLAIGGSALTSNSVLTTGALGGGIGLVNYNSYFAISGFNVYQQYGAWTAFAGVNSTELAVGGAITSQWTGTRFYNSTVFTAGFLNQVFYLGSDVVQRWSSTTSANGSADLGIARNAVNLLEVNTGTLNAYADLKLRQLYADATMTAGGTTGAQTINKSAGSVNFAAAATSLVVTDSLVTATSIVICTIQTNDATMTSVKCVPTSGSFTIYSNAAATAETKVGFLVINK